jgi:hypothetical protein
MIVMAAKRGETREAIAAIKAGQQYVNGQPI